MNAQPVTSAVRRERRPAQWTPSFHGVSHLNGLKRGLQITAVEYSEGNAHAFLLNPSVSGFSSVRESGVVDLAAAKSWAEELADGMDLWGDA